MNKFIIFSCLIVVITSLCANIQATNWRDCRNKTLDDTEKNNADTCCFFYYEQNNDTYQACVPFEKAKVKELVKEGKKVYKTFSIDCSSNLISYSLFLIALIFMI